ncbi:hypothetical protein [Streptomyces alfalfae]|uniref:hypothetical protein n=1 Tax=Streptomyces alfalfae TaxID=1642299 RepID=UPI002811863E|nr:hypothetical protein [Streptomyces alfalfae]
MSTTTLPDSKRLRAALKGEKPPIRFERIGFLSKAGELRKIVWSEPTKSLAENWTFGNLLKREDYDLDDDRPGQRGVYEEQVKKIADGIRTTPRPYLGVRRSTGAVGIVGCGAGVAAAVAGPTFTGAGAKT